MCDPYSECFYCYRSFAPGEDKIKIMVAHKADGERWEHDGYACVECIEVYNFITHIDYMLK